MVEVPSEEYNTGLHDGNNLYSISNNSNWNTCASVYVKCLVSDEIKWKMGGEWRKWKQQLRVSQDFMEHLLFNMDDNKKNELKEITHIMEQNLDTMLKGDK